MYTHERSNNFRHYCGRGFAVFNRVWIKNRFFPDQQKNYTIDDQFNSDKREREKEIDRLLSKMGNNGISDLSAKERKRLDELSKM